MGAASRIIFTPPTSNYTETNSRFRSATASAGDPDDSQPIEEPHRCELSFIVGNIMNSIRAKALERTQPTLATLADLLSPVSIPEFLEVFRARKRLHVA